MFARRIAIICVLLAAFLLATGGCQSSNLTACKAENAKLAKRVFDLETQLADQKEEMENAGAVMGNVFLDLEAREKRIAELEKENADLRKANEALDAKMSTFPNSSKRLIEGVQEIRRVQQEARLKAQQTPSDANKPK
jgi:hypothetical protein